MWAHETVSVQTEGLPAEQSEGSTDRQEAKQLAALDVSYPSATTQVQQPDPQEKAAAALPVPAANAGHDNRDGSALGRQNAAAEIPQDKSMPEVSEQIPCARLPSASGSPAVQAVEPLTMAKSSGMRAMLGRKAAKAISALLRPAPAAGPSPSRSQQANPQTYTSQ